MARRKSGKEKVKRKARQFADEVVEAGYRVKRIATNRTNIKKFSGEVLDAGFRLRDLIKEEPARKKTRKIEYFMAIIVNFALLYVFNHFLDWNVPFVAGSFSGILWAFNLSFLVTIFVNFLWLAADPKWLVLLGKILRDAFGILTIYLLYKVFPFTFHSAFIIWAVKLALFVSLIVMPFIILVRAIRLVALLIWPD